MHMRPKASLEDCTNGLCRLSTMVKQVASCVNESSPAKLRLDTQVRKVHGNAKKLFERMLLYFDENRTSILVTAYHYIRVLLNQNTDTRHFTFEIGYEPHEALPVVHLTAAIFTIRDNYKSSIYR